VASTSSHKPVAKAYTPQNFHFPKCAKGMQCDAAGSFPDLGQAGAIKKYCPSKPTTVAYLDGQGNNQYRKIAHAEFVAEAGVCKTLKTVYDNANDSETTYLSDLNSLVSQGIKVIVTYDDFGCAVLPEIRKAYQHGVQIVGWASPVCASAVAGKDYTGLVIENNYAVGQDAALYLNKQLHGKGNLIYVAGTPGNLLDGDWLAGFRSKADPGLKLLATAQGGWTLDGNTQSVLPLVSKYKKIDAIITSYTATAAGAVQDFINAHKPVPILVGQSDDMQNVCQYWQVHKKQKSFQTYSLDGDQMFIRVALRLALTKAEGKKDTVDPPLNHGEILIDNQPFINTSAGQIPKCNSHQPPGVDFASDLPASQVVQISAS